MLIAASVLTVLIAAAHSYLGERYILVRLFRQSLPKLFGSDHFTRQTLRFAWHLTSVTWIGIAALFILLHFQLATPTNILYILGTTFSVSALVSLIASRGKHMSWLVFGSVAALCFGYTIVA